MADGLVSRNMSRKHHGRLLLVGLVLGMTLLASPVVRDPQPADAATTLTWAEQPHEEPDFIFPFMPLTYDSPWNVNEFQYLMFRPLYWFGARGTPELNQGLSLASAPQYSSTMTSVTVTLKPWHWSDGETITAQDVLFWMNLLHAEKTNWGAYVPNGNDLPDNVRNVTVTGTSQLTFTLTGTVAPNWFTDSQLSQITPLPIAWDKTSLTAPAGSGGCSAAAYGTADTACRDVYSFLTLEAGYDPTDAVLGGQMLYEYAKNPLWQVVDGPWRLASFDPYGRVTLVPNRSYSGPDKPTITRFQEVPFGTYGQEYGALRQGTVSVGYLRVTDVDQSTANALVGGPNNANDGNYQIIPQYPWEITYFPYNFDSEGDQGAAGSIFHQLYVRQAIQLLVNQPGLIRALGHGYGVGTYGPVPIQPRSAFASSLEKSNPYPYNPREARTLLADHGWKRSPGGSLCVRPGTATNECGVGILGGARLRFELQYAAGSGLLADTLQREHASWAQAGIDVILEAKPFESVVNNSSPCPNGCSWQLEDPGTSWEFFPEIYPSGENLFATGAFANFGDYSDPTTDSDIAASENSTVGLTQYQNYVATQLPVVFEPDYAAELVEVQNGLQGVAPLNVFGSLLPENWRI
jgi:peptide/nickel transport system substrate-binding protein